MIKPNDEHTHQHPHTRELARRERCHDELEHRCAANRAAAVEERKRRALDAVADGEFKNNMQRREIGDTAYFAARGKLHEDRDRAIKHAEALAEATRRKLSAALMTAWLSVAVPLVSAFRHGPRRESDAKADAFIEALRTFNDRAREELGAEELAAEAIFAAIGDEAISERPNAVYALGMDIRHHRPRILQAMASLRRLVTRSTKAKSAVLLDEAIDTVRKWIDQHEGAAPDERLARRYSIVRSHPVVQDVLRELEAFDAIGKPPVDAPANAFVSSLKIVEPLVPGESRVLDY